MYDANKSIMTKETTDYDAIGVCLKTFFLPQEYNNFIDKF